MLDKAVQQNGAFENYPKLKKVLSSFSAFSPPRIDNKGPRRMMSAMPPISVKDLIIENFIQEEIENLENTDAPRPSLLNIRENIEEEEVAAYENNDLTVENADEPGIVNFYDMENSNGRYEAEQQDNGHHENGQYDYGYHENGQYDYGHHENGQFENGHHENTDEH
jgi:hypothetical protein